MKTPTQAVLNKVAPANELAAAEYAAKLLYTGLLKSAPVTLRKAIPALLAKPTNPAMPANGLFPGSPAFAAGAARPAYPAITSPAIVSLPGWVGAVKYTATECQIYLPFGSSDRLIDPDQFWADSISKIGEITPAALTVPDYLGLPGGGAPGLIEVLETPTVEKFLFKNALYAFEDDVPGVSISDSEWFITTPNGDIGVACKYIVLPLAGGDGGGAGS